MREGKRTGRNGKRKLFLYRMVFCILLLVMAASAATLFYYMVAVPFHNRQATEQLKEDYAPQVPEAEDGSGTSPTEEPAGKESIQGIPEFVDLKSLQEKYPDVKGWLEIPGTGIDYPVLQGDQSDPERYLRRNYQGDYDINGSLFLQWNCEVPDGENLIIYGHNMNSGVMFGNLDRYADPDYLKEHSAVFLQTSEGVREYEVYTVLKADVSMFDFRQVYFGNCGLLDSYLAAARSLQVCGNDRLSPENTEQVLTLVTCSYEWDEARNIVIAVCKEEIPSKDALS